MKKNKNRLARAISFEDGYIKDCYNSIDYEDAFNHIRALADLEWNGQITIIHFKERVDEIISIISEKEADNE